MWKEPYASLPCRIYVGRVGRSWPWAKCPSVCLSVKRSIRLSVCQTHELWQNERNLCVLAYSTWKNLYPSFLTRRMVGGGELLYVNFLNFAACDKRSPWVTCVDLVVSALVASWPPLFSVFAELHIFKVIRLRAKLLSNETVVTTISRNMLLRTLIRSLV